MCEQRFVLKGGSRLDTVADGLLRWSNLLLSILL
jgi:hypothetical protein